MLDNPAVEVNACFITQSLLMEYTGCFLKTVNAYMQIDSEKGK
jgi:hypothetical protein